jgi:hypothetical protein
MPLKYLLPCACGRVVPVTTTQAGAEVSCPCGQTLLVPTLLELKQLPQAQDAESKNAKASWTPLQGGVFVAGALIALASLGTAGFLSWERSHLQTAKPELASEAEYITDTRKRNVDDLWNLWDALSDPNTWPRQRPRILRYAVDRQTDIFLRKSLYVAVGCALAGVALSCSSFFIRISPRSEKRRRARKPSANRGRGTSPR